jgi:hypothetical protein
VKLSLDQDGSLLDGLPVGGERTVTLEVKISLLFHVCKFFREFLVLSDK